MDRIIGGHKQVLFTNITSYFPYFLPFLNGTNNFGKNLYNMITPYSLHNGDFNNPKNNADFNNPK